MKKDLLKKIKKDDLLKRELRRAHFMILLLAVGIMLLTFVNTFGHVELGDALAVSLIVLSGFVAIISGLIVFRLAGK